jgi:hypothetical protein
MNSKTVLGVLFTALVLYVGSYVVLSLGGQYVPSGWGLGWVKWYAWAPRGFVSGPEGIDQNRFPQAFYYPLRILDVRFVHTSRKAYDGNHPVNTVLDDKLRARLKEYEASRAAEEKGGEVTEERPSTAETSRNFE